MSLSVRGRALGEAVKPSARTLPWATLAAAALLGVVFLLLLRPRSAGSQPIGALRIAAVLLAAATGFCLDDRAEPTLAASPTTRLARRVVRLGVGLATAAGAWAALAALALVLTPGHDLPVAALTVEAAGMAAVALAVAGLTIERSPDGLGGVASGPALLALLLGSHVASVRWQVFSLLPVGPGDPIWTEAHIRWGLLLALSLGVVLACSADPARRRLGFASMPKRT